jgi:hypothetical protein
VLEQAVRPAAIVAANAAASLADARILIMGCLPASDVTTRNGLPLVP